MKDSSIWIAVLFALVALAVPSVSWAQGPPPAPPTHPDRWMGELFQEAPSAMDQSLARFIFPGTHDSGTFATLAVGSVRRLLGLRHVRGSGSKLQGRYSRCLRVVYLHHCAKCFGADRPSLGAGAARDHWAAIG